MSSNNTEDNKQHSSIGDMTSNKKENTSCEQSNVSVTERVESVAILKDTSICAACGKEGNSDNMNTCNKPRLGIICPWTQ